MSEMSSLDPFAQTILSGSRPCAPASAARSEAALASG